jgi:hypothetical protein
MFFSHTVKKQPANRELLRQVLKKNITLIDYELLTNEQGERIVAFGRWAGIVGAYNGLLTYGRKHQLFDLKSAYQCVDMEDMQEEFFKVKKVPPIKMAVTGSGRVAQGAVEVLDKMGIRRVSVYDYLYLDFNEPVYTQLRSSDYNRRRDGRVWDTPDFHRNPREYESTFGVFLPVTDLQVLLLKLIGGQIFGAAPTRPGAGLRPVSGSRRPPAGIIRAVRASLIRIVQRFRPEAGESLARGGAPRQERVQISCNVFKWRRRFRPEAGESRARGGIVCARSGCFKYFPQICPQPHPIPFLLCAR